MALKSTVRTVLAQLSEISLYFRLLSSMPLIRLITPVALVVLALVSYQPVTWVPAVLLILISGFALHFFLNNIFSSNDNNLITVPTLSVVMSSGTYLLLNYLLLPLSRVYFLWFLGLLTSALFFLSYSLPKLRRKVTNRSQSLIAREAAFTQLKDAYTLPSRIRNFFVPVFVATFLIILLTATFDLALSFLIWPSWLPTLTTYLSPLLPILMITIIGIPLTIIFWILLVDPSLSSYRSLSTRIIGGKCARTLTDNHQRNTLHTLAYLMPSVILAFILALLPNVIGFLPPGFDTPFHIVYLRGIYSEHFNFPFPIGGRLRGARPATYLLMASIMQTLGVDAITAYEIFVITTYVLTTVAVFLLVLNFDNLRIAALTSILFCISLPTLELIAGLSANLYGMFLFLMSLVFLFAPDRDNTHKVKFVMVGVLLILTHELVTLLFFWVIATLLLLEVIYSTMNRGLRERATRIIRFLFLCSIPFIIVSPYLVEYIRIYALRFPYMFISEASTDSSVPLQSLYSSAPIVWTPKGWFGPLLLLACFCGFYAILKHNFKQLREEKEGTMGVMNGILFGLPLLLWLLTSLGIFSFLADDPFRALLFLTFPISYTFASFALKRKSNPHISSEKPRIPVINRLHTILNLKLSLTLAVISILLFSSMQYSMGIYPNILNKPWAPAAIPITGLSFEGYQTMLWMRENGLKGTVVVDGTFGTWPAVLANMTTVIFWSFNEVQIWREYPFWEKRISLNTSGAFEPLFLLDLVSKYNVTPLPVYLMVSYGFLGNAFPKTSQSLLDKMVDKIYESEGEGKEKVSLYRLDGIPEYLLYDLSLEIERDGFKERSSIRLEPKYEDNIYKFTMNLTGGGRYTISSIPIELEFESIFPQPSHLEIQEEELRIESDPSVTYTLTFKSEAPYLKYVWKESSFQTGWTSEGTGNFTSVDGVATLKLKITDYEDFIQIFKQLELNKSEEQTDYFLSIRHKSNSTNIISYSYTIAVRLWSETGVELFYKELPHYEDFTTDAILIPHNITLEVFKIGLLLYGRYPGDHEWRIQSISFTV